ncbi:hypothetical protein [Portibacter marinus]|uniref:hypothetical protein n=1 Tax=Portibacter marinus TaxID=2898660 RepID=UPI001F48E924|nr:hypothetical protein [Portibacter marinus]
MTTRFDSFEEFKKEVKIEYYERPRSCVELIQRYKDRELVSKLCEGLKESEITDANNGSILDKLSLMVKSPYFIANRYDMLKIWLLARNRPYYFGNGDIAFYNVAVAMQDNIRKETIKDLQTEDFSEKGYINTFNHVISQAFMTALYGEKLADFIADTHERNKLPELITGEFSETQINDLDEGPLDNYIDVINNKWGQELGKMLRIKYGINRYTIWDQKLLVSFLNDLQSYFMWSLDIQMKAFSEQDPLVYKFATKINKINLHSKGMM